MNELQKGSLMVDLNNNEIEDVFMLICEQHF